MASSFQSLTINDTGNLTFPNGTVANRPTTTPTIIRWTNTGTPAVSVLSGTATTTTTSWTCPSGVTRIEVLVVAGGGGGGSTYHAGGGGAGGLIYRSVYSVIAGAVYSVTVGAGGAGGTSGLPGARGSNGSNSVFDTLTAIGGGGGTSYGVNSPGADGGSGGGGSQQQAGGWVNYVGGAGTAGQGFSGGNSAYTYDSSWMGAGGGGGAGGPGQAGDNFPDQLAGGTGGKGGPGLPFDISGTVTYYAGGGGGSGGNAGGTGGIGGGGDGGNSVGAGQATAGTASTGGGGGGSERTNSSSVVAYAGGAGGSGVVIIRYFQDASLSDPNAQLRFNTGTQVTEAFAANKWRDIRTDKDIINDGLVLYIDPAKYVAGASTVTDLSPTNATCTLTNGVGYSSANGGYFTLDGTNDHIRIPMSSAINTCQKGQTISYWAYPTGLGDYHFYNNHIQGATSVGAVSGSILALGSGGTLTYQNRINNSCCQTVSGVGSYTANKWIHITGAWDGQYMRLYKNGQLVSGLAAAGSLNMINDIFLGVNSDTFRIDGTYAQVAAGRLGPFMLYNRALSDDEIRANYNVHVSRYTTVPQVAYTPTYVKDNLVMCMDPEQKYFNYESNIIYDAASGYPLTLTNGSSYNIADRSVQFAPGSYSYIAGSTMGAQMGKNLTMDAWIYITSYSGRTRQYIIDLRGNGSDTSPYIYLLLDYQNGTDNIRWTFLGGGGGSELQSSTISMPLNTWHHICAVRDNTSARIYQDGTLISTSDQANQSTGDCTLNQAFRIGTYAAAGSGAEYYMSGKMAGARAYSRALTPQEVQQNYQALKHRYGLM